VSLSSSERAILIKGITEMLSLERWACIDSTLGNFLLPTDTEWNGNPTNYVAKMVENASDQVLTDLAEHVGFPFQEEFSEIELPNFWQKRMLKVFVSHLADYRDYAGKLQEALLSLGISCFVAHKDIEPTLVWQDEILAALTTCDALVALLHPNFHASKWTDQEIGFAMGLGVPTFAVRLGEEPYGFISRFQAFSGSGKIPNQMARELFDKYRKNNHTKRRMGGVLVDLFANNTNYAETKERIVFLEELEDWEPSFTKRIRAGEKSNSQIRDAWGVPDRIKSLIAKWAT
jgi:hypothetical protein